MFRLIIMNTIMQVRARSIENLISYSSLIGNGCRFYVPKASEIYNPKFSKLICRKYHVFYFKMFSFLFCTLKLTRTHS